MRVDWKKAIIFAVVFGLFSALAAFVCETLLGISIEIVSVVDCVLFVLLGTQLKIWEKKKIE